MDRMVERNMRRAPRGGPVGAIVSCLLILLPVCGTVAHAADGSVAVENTWSRATPDGVAVGVGFATIKNAGDEDDRLVSATTEVAGETEIHEMSMDGGVMKMRKLADGLVVPAGGEVALRPGGYHLMLMDLKKPLKEGEPFSGTLTFEKAGPVDVEFKVMGLGAMPEGNAHGHH